MADTDEETTIQELFDEFDVRLVRRDSDPVEALDLPFKDLISIVSRVTMERMIREKPAAIETPLIIKPPHRGLGGKRDG